jgi:hypothetical protein
VLDDLEEVDGDAGEAIAQGFAARELLARTPDEALLEMALSVGPGVRLESASISRGEGWEVKGAVLRRRRGLHLSVTVDAAMASLIGRCDGARPLRGLACEVAQGLGLDPQRVMSSLLPLVCGLVERGFLLPPTASQ